MNSLLISVDFVFGCKLNAALYSGLSLPRFLYPVIDAGSVFWIWDVGCVMCFLFSGYWVQILWCSVAGFVSVLHYVFCNNSILIIGYICSEGVTEEEFWPLVAYWLLAFMAWSEPKWLMGVAVEVKEIGVSLYGYWGRDIDSIWSEP